ncbi:MAG: tRNA (guanosine(46)-N7)-methyltransferase TrmB [Spirochaetaceae bacterium]|jgi:tRNA (guanine-N7-)-methyltransferase|nr:tRNA (guanosine(46)-N7)-methyltransferase TrmB [Spirochaetaceae bacterium]
MTRLVKSFVLRSGRMSRAQSRSYGEGNGPFLVPYDGSVLHFASLFGNDHSVTVEIGFGMGGATAEIARANPEKNYLGVEVFKAGIGKLIWEIRERGLSNIRIMEHDAAEVLEHSIPPQSLDALHIFFPDPWPKKRHHKRRLIQGPFAELMISRLRAEAYLYVVSDWEDYARGILELLSALPELENPYPGFAEPLRWRPRTKFEKKGLEKNRRIYEIYLCKRKGK